jgi:4-hydroxy-3-methylbut-2-enyl diphosphate reductase
VVVVAQTTQDESLFQEVVERLEKRYPDVLVFNTICNATHERQSEVKRLARQVDGLIIVGGYNSGNTRRLVGIARAAGAPCFHVETEKELDKKELRGFKTLGVTAGASTPNWMIRQVVQELESIQGRGETLLSPILFRFLRFMLKTNLMVAFGAACLSLVVSRLRQAPWQWIPGAITFFYIYAMHILNHLLDSGAAEYNDPDRSQLYQRYRPAFFASGIGASVLSLFLTYRLGWRPFLLLSFMTLLGLLYSIQIVPAVGQRVTSMKKIKDLPASKTLSVALGWGGVTTLIPMLAEGRPLTPGTLIIFLVVCSFVYIRSGLFDILDIQGDMIVGKETLPILIGEEKTLRFLKILCLGTMVLLSLASLSALLPRAALGLLIALGYQGLLLFIFEKKWALPGSIFFETLIESSFLLAGLIALALV